ncbi:hypothetical protein BC829DRAFT_388737, partial [Chytridium lagenaria]
MVSGDSVCFCFRLLLFSDVGVVPCCLSTNGIPPVPSLRRLVEHCLAIPRSPPRASPLCAYFSSYLRSM